MKKTLITVIFLSIVFLIIRGNLNIIDKTEKAVSTKPKQYHEITGNIKKGETLFDIFKKYKLDIIELFKLKEASADIHKLKDLYPGHPYKIIIDDSSQINEFIYWIDDDNILNITRTESGFCAEKKAVEYEKKIEHIGGTINDNLILSMGEGRENLMLALQLSDIFAWDIDFTTDLRNGDVFKIVVEGLYLDRKFKKYGDILTAEFINNGETYYAYRFENDGKFDYYDAYGKSLRRTFLKAPLSFRRISSGFSKRRFHPILKIFRPHLGVDYAAPTGTPVSAVGDGTVVFSGYKGDYGNIVMIKHFNSFRTYYGHLSKIKKGIKKGVNVEQGQIIGYVGATGLATGPHLDYRVKVNNRFINPLKLNLPRKKSIPNNLMAEFKKSKNEMDIQLASITPSAFAFAVKNKDNKI
jgi:murein DD-endopeptidase MepM/ murein hydrolase activator NlpD